MMTSVTLPSSSGPIHGGFSTSVAEETNVNERDFEPPRPAKRNLFTSFTESCKKRRKQYTPVRISAADSPPEGKPSVSSPEPESICPICQLVFNNPDLLQTHLTTEHVPFETKKEREDSPAPTANDIPEQPIMEAMPKPEIPWMSDLPNKEWMSPNLLSFSPANHMFMGLPSFTQPDTMPPRQPIRIFNPDAYCELCNKEFCNKYFLKTHKANKHGIYSDPPASETNISNSVNIPSYVGNMKIPTTVPSSDQPIKDKPGLVPPYSDLFTNPYANKMFSKISKPLFEPETIINEGTTTSNGIPHENERSEDNHAEETSVSPRVQQSEPLLMHQAFKQEDQELFFTSPSKMSPGQQARELDLSNRLRRIGVMNPKAFCEICCKEYCNKYFLRTHKMKRHGIFIPDDREKDAKMENVGVPYTQTSPLNLIIAEQSNSSDRKTSSPSDISCELCGIKFQNLSLFQLHNVSVHAKSQEQQNNDEKKTEAEKSNNSADSISEDLQKLQTMILQLNDLDVSKANSTCMTCKKEFENRYYLHAHMMTEHGLLLDENDTAEKANEQPEVSINNNSMCDLCGKDFHSYDDLKKHILESHRITQTSEVIKDEFNNGFTTPEKGPAARPVTANVSVAERRTSMNMTPTSSYCEICNKELCNKYFMKTHMQRMHGIEIENGAQIGGVICDICNKELCSKYFLRVHKHNTHGIVEYGTSLLQPRKEENTPLPVEPDPALKPADLADLSHRYFTHFTEVCTICSRRFRSTKWLKAHLLSDHGQVGAEKWAELEQQLQHTMNKASATTISTIKNSQGERVSPTLKIPNSTTEPIAQQKVGLQTVLSSIFGADESSAKNYQCPYCPFSTSVLPFLFVHERSHSLQSGDGDNVQLKCPVCLQSFSQPDLLQQHIFSQHPFLPLPPFFNGNAEPAQGERSKEPSESADETNDNNEKDKMEKMKNAVMVKRKRLDVPPEMDQTLKDVAKKSQLPAIYALPQSTGNGICNAEDEPAYVMQAFLLEEQQQLSAAEQNKFMPSIVFLPVLQKLTAPITATFTLTPA